MISDRKQRPASALMMLTCVFVLLGFSYTTLLVGQQEEATRLDLGIDKSNPGGQAFLPIIFSPAAGVQVATLSAEITFPAKQLAFQEVKKGGSADSVDVNIQAAVKNSGKNPNESILEVVVENKTGPLMGGVVANLVFKILEQVPMGEKIQLEESATALTRDNPPKTLRLTAAKGEIETIPVPVVFACLFYMH